MGRGVGRLSTLALVLSLAVSAIQGAGAVKLRVMGQQRECVQEVSSVPPRCVALGVACSCTSRTTCITPQHPAHAPPNPKPLGLCR